MDNETVDPSDFQGEEYSDLLRLEDLESLLEELEEVGAGDEAPPELMEQLHAYDLSDIDALRERIRLLHARLDAKES